MDLNCAKTRSTCSNDITDALTETVKSVANIYRRLGDLCSQFNGATTRVAVDQEKKIVRREGFLPEMEDRVAEINANLQLCKERLMTIEVSFGCVRDTSEAIEERTEVR